MASDYYRMLGVNRNADDNEIKKAFRRLAKQFHPDANPDNPQAEARFKEINEAYATLSDPDKRAKYDRYGSSYARYGGTSSRSSSSRSTSTNTAAGSNGSGAGSADFDVNDTGNWGDIFDSIFGFGGRSKEKERRDETTGLGKDIEKDITITLREAYEGTTRYITKGINKGNRRIRVNIPPGSDTGTRVRLVGEGEKGTQGPGDLYLIVQLEPDDVFERDGDNLYTNVDIDMFTAILGGEVRVPTMARPVKLKVPPNTQAGMKFRVNGKGMPRLRKKDEYGDLYARVVVKVPTDLDDQQQALLLQLQQSLLGDGE